jgi:hypothetical protein
VDGMKKSMQTSKREGERLGDNLVWIIQDCCPDVTRIMSGKEIRQHWCDMSITEDELVDSYETGNAKERFDLIYKNYSVFPQLVDCF